MNRALYSEGIRICEPVLITSLTKLFWKAA